MKFFRSTLAIALFSPSLLLAQETETTGWYLKPTFSFSQLSDQTGNTLGIGGLDGSTTISVDAGFASGLSLGYSYNDRWSAEFGWEYRSNDSEVTLADGQRFNDGNYASNSFFLNGIYSFESNRAWTPYVGLGLNWIQEVDIDLETAGTELSYAGDGDTGFQAFAGFDYPLNPRWSVLGELRYSSITDLELTGENTTGSIRGIDYDPFSLQIGFKYKF